MSKKASFLYTFLVVFILLRLTDSTNNWLLRIIIAILVAGVAEVLKNIYYKQKSNRQS